MMSISEFLQVLIPLYIMVFIGFISKKTTIFGTEMSPFITKLLLYITLPALILHSLHTTFSKKIVIEFSWLLLMSIFTLSMSMFIARWLRNKSTLTSKQNDVFESLIIFGNQGFIGYAVIYTIMGDQGVMYLSLFNILYFVCIWTYGIYLFTKDSQKVDWKMLLLNPGIISTCIGLVMLFSPYKWPSPFLQTFESVGKMTIPLSMILIGNLLASVSRNELYKIGKNIFLWIASSFKLLLIPLLLFIFLLFKAPYHLLTIAVLTAAMPSAPTISIYAQRFNGDAQFASIGVLLSTILCIFTLPLLYSLLQWFYTSFF